VHRLPLQVRRYVRRLLDYTLKSSLHASVFFNPDFIFKHGNWNKSPPGVIELVALALPFLQELIDSSRGSSLNTLAVLEFVAIAKRPLNESLKPD
jgi:hypothetical protein